MSQSQFTDIHCHLVPGIDDGASDLAETLAMARMAVDDGLGTVICTPHQGGNFSHNQGDQIRAAVRAVQKELDRARIPLKLLPGADVRIESNMIDQLKSGEAVSLGDLRRHVLLELPHELYIPLQPVLDGLRRVGMVGILSHPERNQGILTRPAVLKPLVEAGCLMQLTAGSLVGAFGHGIQQFSEWMLREGLIHFIATDAHGIKSRRPKLQPAFRRATELVGDEIAMEICCHNPALVASGQDVKPGYRVPKRRKRRWFGRRAG